MQHILNDVLQAEMRAEREQRLSALATAAAAEVMQGWANYNMCLRNTTPDQQEVVDIIRRYMEQL
jgi:hypothetical protein